MNTQKRQLIAALSLCAAIIAPSIASAAVIPSQGDWTTTLQARYLGNSTTINAYYDTSLNITWLANANAAVGSVYDTYSPGSGRMDWTTANTWAAHLNINGVTGWRLPKMTDPAATCYTFTYSGGPCGWNNPSTSEMAHMYYTTLGDKGEYDTSGVMQAGYGLTNTGPFSNVQSDYYWSATEYAPTPSYAWRFYAGNGGQYGGYKTFGQYAWAVHAGNVGAVSAVPEPAAAWMFGSGLMVLMGISCKRRGRRGQVQANCSR